MCPRYFLFRGPAPSAEPTGLVLSLWRLAWAKAAPSESAAPGVGVPSQWSGDTSVVSTANCAPPNRSRPSTISKLTAITRIKCCNVQVSHHDVGRDSAPCFSAHAGTSAFQCKTSPPKKSVKGTPHQQKREDRGKWQHTEQATLDPIVAVGRRGRERHSAPGPLCDLIKALWEALMVVMTRPSRKSHSHGTEASYCQLALGPGSFSSVLSVGVASRGPMLSTLVVQIRGHLSLLP